MDPQVFYPLPESWDCSRCSHWSQSMDQFPSSSSSSSSSSPISLDTFPEKKAQPVSLQCLEQLIPSCPIPFPSFPEQSLPGPAFSVPQVLGKSCKPIPVMLLGVTLLRKRYPPAKYLCVLLIVAGVALFLYKPKKGTGDTELVFGYGELLLLLSLTLDGLTGVSQDHMRAHYQTSSNHMMLNVNLWSTLFLGAGILFTGELWEFLSFTERYPSIISNILLFGLTSALGQSFIFMTVVYFGPLTCSILTTTRKFFTILASVVLFANPISPLQWVGTVLVFLGLGLDAKFGKGVKKTSH
uniref:Solute carrier family 35 member B1 n=3 Tax=Muscicapidae TaxID=36291 RepID=U3JXF4_FICAL